MVRGGDGPSRFRIRRKQVPYYSRMSRPVYRFAEDPDEDEMKNYID